MANDDDLEPPIGEEFRGQDEVLAAYNEFWDKVWYARNRESELSGEHDAVTTDELNRIIEQARAAATRIEEKYGLENLCADSNAFEFGLLSGRMSALAWVLGSEWEGSLDT